MPLPSLTESTIRDRVTPKVFQRGEHYYQAGAVANICSRGNTIQATVEGNEVEPYRVNIQFDRGGIKQVNCTCAYAFEGWCKHIVATTLVCLHQQSVVQERPSLEQLLDQLNPIQTQQLVQELVAETPELIDQIDRLVTLIGTPTPKTVTKVKRQTNVDPQPYRYQVKQLMRNTLQYWEEGWEEDPIEEELPGILAQAEKFTERGDGNDALVILAAITQACAEDWDEIADYGGDGDDLIARLDPIWAAAILCAEFQPGEEVDLQINLEAWQDNFGGSFDLSAAALRQGWDDVALQAVLRGESTDVWQDNRPDYADQFAQVRLHILERQGRHAEYLNLAAAEGQIPEYLTMLTRLGRITEVMATQRQLTFGSQALEVAKALREQGAVSEALEIAQYGLTLPESNRQHSNWATIHQYETVGCRRYELAVWTSELAEGLGEGTVALSARIEAFTAQPSFRDYQKVQYLAGESWSTVKADLLKYLRQSDASWRVQEAKIDIFLDEGLIEDAIATLGNYASNKLVDRVMAAAIPHQPEWVMEKARRYAEQIMDQGKANAYEEAVEWLRKARAAYNHLGQQAQWQLYRAQLMKTHSRKYKLMGLLKHPNLT
jgi:uncharacterized Zn finger protein